MWRRPVCLNSNFCFLLVLKLCTRLCVCAVGGKGPGWCFFMATLNLCFLSCSLCCPLTLSSASLSLSLSLSLYCTFILAVDSFTRLFEEVWGQIDSKSVFPSFPLKLNSVHFDLDYWIKMSRNNYTSVRYFELCTCISQKFPTMFKLREINAAVKWGVRKKVGEQV